MRPFFTTGLARAVPALSLLSAVALVALAAGSGCVLLLDTEKLQKGDKAGAAGAAGASGAAGTLVERRAAMLVEYHDAAYAARYRAFVEKVADAERRVAPGSSALADAVARNFHKLMAIKDEYEVARLYTDGRFAEQLREAFEGKLRVTFHLAPPILQRIDPATGEPVKRTFGPWMFPVLKLLARMKALRGTALDVFGRTEERRTERALIDEYARTMDDVVARLNLSNLPVAVQLARQPESIRGFGHVKARNVAQARTEREELLRRFREAK